MDRLSFNDLADVYLMFGLVKGNATEARDYQFSIDMYREVSKM